MNIQDEILKADHFQNQRKSREAFDAYVNITENILSQIKAETQFNDSSEFISKPTDSNLIVQNLKHCCKQIQFLLNGKSSQDEIATNNETIASNNIQPQNTLFSELFIPFSPLYKLISINKQAYEIAKERIQAAKRQSSDFSIESWRRVCEDFRLQRKNWEDVTKQIVAASKISMMSIDVAVLARHLTQLDSHLFQKVDLQDPLKFVSNNVQSNYAVACTHFQLYLTSVVAHIIITAGYHPHPTHLQRAHTIQYFIRLAHHLLIQYRNLNSFCAVIQALNCPQVKRLNLVWDLVPQKYRDHFNEYQKLVLDQDRHHFYFMELNQRIEHSQYFGSGLLVIPWMQPHFSEGQSIYANFGSNSTSDPSQISLSNYGLNKLTNITDLLKNCYSANHFQSGRVSPTMSIGGMSSSTNFSRFRSSRMAADLEPHFPPLKLPSSLSNLGEQNIQISHWILTRIRSTQAQLWEFSHRVQSASPEDLRKEKPLPKEPQSPGDSSLSSEFSLDLDVSNEEIYPTEEKSPVLSSLDSESVGYNDKMRDDFGETIPANSSIHESNQEELQSFLDLRNSPSPIPPPALDHISFLNHDNPWEHSADLTENKSHVSNMGRQRSLSLSGSLHIDTSFTQHSDQSPLQDYKMASPISSPSLGSSYVHSQLANIDPSNHLAIQDQSPKDQDSEIGTPKADHVAFVQNDSINDVLYSNSQNMNQNEPISQDLMNLETLENQNISEFVQEFESIYQPQNETLSQDQVVDTLDELEDKGDLMFENINHDSHHSSPSSDNLSSNSITPIVNESYQSNSSPETNPKSNDLIDNQLDLTPISKNSDISQEHLSSDIHSTNLQISNENDEKLISPIDHENIQTSKDLESSLLTDQKDSIENNTCSLDIDNNVEVPSIHSHLESDQDLQTSTDHLNTAQSEPNGHLHAEAASSKNLQEISSVVENNTQLDLAQSSIQYPKNDQLDYQVELEESSAFHTKENGIINTLTNDTANDSTHLVQNLNQSDINSSNIEDSNLSLITSNQSSEHIIELAPNGQNQHSSLPVDKTSLQVETVDANLDHEVNGLIDSSQISESNELEKSLNQDDLMEQGLLPNDFSNHNISITSSELESNFKFNPNAPTFVPKNINESFTQPDPSDYSNLRETESSTDDINENQNESLDEISKAFPIPNNHQLVLEKYLANNPHLQPFQQLINSNGVANGSLKFINGMNFGPNTVEQAESSFSQETLAPEQKKFSSTLSLLKKSNKKLSAPVPSNHHDKDVVSELLIQLMNPGQTLSNQQKPDVSPTSPTKTDSSKLPSTLSSLRKAPVSKVSTPNSSEQVYDIPLKHDQNEPANDAKPITRKSLSSLYNKVESPVSSEADDTQPPNQNTKDSSNGTKPITRKSLSSIYNNNDNLVPSQVKHIYSLVSSSLKSEPNHQRIQTTNGIQLPKSEETSIDSIKSDAQTDQSPQQSNGIPVNQMGSNISTDDLIGSADNGILHPSLPESTNSKTINFAESPYLDQSIVATPDLVGITPIHSPESGSLKSQSDTLVTPRLDLDAIPGPFPDQGDAFKSAQISNGSINGTRSTRTLKWDEDFDELDQLTDAPQDSDSFNHTQLKPSGPIISEDNVIEYFSYQSYKSGKDPIQKIFKNGLNLSNEPPTQAKGHLDNLNRVFDTYHHFGFTPNVHHNSFTHQVSDIVSSNREFDPTRSAKINGYSYRNRKMNRA